MPPLHSLALSSSREEDGQNEVVPGVEVRGFGQRVTNYRLCLRASIFDRVCVCVCVWVCVLCVFCVCVCVCAVSYTPMTLPTVFTFAHLCVSVCVNIIYYQSHHAYVSISNEQLGSSV